MDTQTALERISGKGFIAALDQSGGSSPKALAAYGVEESAWGGDQEQMFEMIHGMRTRIIVDDAFDQRICGAILFERTMNSEVEGMPTAQYLSEKKNIVPFLKVDEGLQDEANGVQLMKEMKGLTERLASANQHGIFGTKMRSVIQSANAEGISAIVAQQFEVGGVIIDAGLMPILEPEVNIKSADKAACEEILRDELIKALDTLPEDRHVMLKLTLPEAANFYKDVINHPRVLRVVALSGGYSRDEANTKLTANADMTASFSRALVQDLRSDQSAEEFTAALDSAIDSIYQASTAEVVSV
ncbi:MAG: fructose bisphosphate aldolase [Candidatus Peribacter sp.]|jgi:fructose-bisphosphate aldolase, class I|nr:fructose bisphosphate aldolase [Candidatus Peribacter sp.]MBT4393475.1 fructose bisphosphate aldolase [Candidatus Peribacter sp.]MBT4600834.1 fructose bisphosphate aldolase [Candidatus Peribacter sp.]MBT5149481.1 fructose bisphosphate aldolase [Candidatus Peribacter sp.]MBT5637320.1 fructose bisphosphate aldolase [Candidatus Peribacter sp.]